MIICGIDPGLMGGIAFVETRSTEGMPRATAHDMPVIRTTKTRKELDVMGVVNLLCDPRPDAVFVEKVGAMPGQGVTSMFRFGLGYGILLGICGGLRLPVTLVRPRTWQAVSLRDMDKSKGASVARSRQLWPDIELVTPRGRLIDGRADALLIAWYGTQTMLGESRVP